MNKLIITLAFVLSVSSHAKTFVYCSEGSPSGFNLKLQQTVRQTMLQHIQFTIVLSNLNTAQQNSPQALRRAGQFQRTKRLTHLIFERVLSFIKQSTSLPRESSMLMMSFSLLIDSLIKNTRTILLVEETTNTGKGWGCLNLSNQLKK